MRSNCTRNNNQELDASKFTSETRRAHFNTSDIIFNLMFVSAWARQREREKVYLMGKGVRARQWKWRNGRKAEISVNANIYIIRPSQSYRLLRLMHHFFLCERLRRRIPFHLERARSIDWFAWAYKCRQNEMTVCERFDCFGPNGSAEHFRPQEKNGNGNNFPFSIV